MDRFFKIKEQGSTVRTEIMAGITTFMTMAYILAVNPNILTAFGKTGMEWYPVFLATAIAAGIFTIAMGIFVNFPVALAPGMGLNAYFATVIVSTAGSDHPITWQMALTAVFISGIVFFLLTVTHIRQKLLEAVPDALKHAITVGIGLFITIVGLKNSGLLSVSVEAVNDVPKGVFTPLQGFETVFGLGSFTDPNVLLTIIGLALISVLMILNVPGAILFGILGTALIAIPMGLIDFSSLQGAQWVPDLTQMTVFEFDFAGIMGVGIVSIILTFTFVELFDTFGTLVGTANRAGFMKNREEGNKRVGKAMFVDSIAVGGGAVLGTSTVTAFVESSAGVAAGGRTGLTSVTTGICFLLALFLAPVIALIPGPATAAALIVVGVLMMQAVREINFNDLVIGIPAFMTITFMPFTYSIANGISFGILGYVLLAFVANVFGKGEQKYKIHWLMWILFVLVILRYVFMGGH
ncbi:NCS2 family permease [Paenibacillus dendritiformis]|uniref:Xanthine/uracil/vitamin C permease n=1 Tax=Paenibacillus dendritiformis C454 TaxID=1131935 RepID=H3SM34_9BACL|nr:NCS2 family permease [Paenibacillus dendritiformis]EHQ59849.1 Xanthine/uracil/vitamin C permease [Paenibacillus dendritiformis C454]MDU5143083.1 NCS2 family permease [Paenibacillus dendritiformis]NKI22791.1 NCS2 family permease [Paenibacillus dendritiformis]NRF97118.1 NCS2 family permease [Paenibacillus dendritiformis]WGU92587.1 NCS2 family permease [Paenibacillus dendritiformis]